MRDSLKIQLILLAALVVLTPIVVQIFLIRPLQAQRSAQSQAILTQQNQNEKMLQEIEKLVGQFQREDLNRDLAILDGAIIDKRSPVAFISTIEDLAQAAGVEHTLQFEQDVDPALSDLQTIPLTLRGQGGYEELLRFLRSLEQQPFYLSFDEITIQPIVTGGETSSQLQFLAHGQTTWK